MHRTCNIKYYNITFILRERFYNCMETGEISRLSVLILSKQNNFNTHGDRTKCVIILQSVTLKCGTVGTISPKAR